jgi:hypothetical protein
MGCLISFLGSLVVCSETAPPPAVGVSRRYCINRKHVEEEPLVQLPRPLGIGIRQRALGGCLSHTKMVELAARHPQAVRDLAHALGLRKLTEEHRHELVPTRETPGITLRFRLSHASRLHERRNNAQYLPEQAGTMRHGSGSLVGGFHPRTPFHHCEPLPVFNPKPILDKCDQYGTLTHTPPPCRDPRYEVSF